MGQNFTTVFGEVFPPKGFRALMLGEDGVGKTAIMYKAKLNETITTIPTIGFNVQSIKCKKYDITMWDVGGMPKIRPLWRHYFPETSVLIFVVDSSNPGRIQSSKNELDKLLNEPQLENAAFLIYANKQDKAVMSVAEVVEKMGLYQIKNRQWYIIGSNALTGEGIMDGLEWAVSAFSKMKK